MALNLQILISEEGETLNVDLETETNVGRSDQNRLQINESYVSSRHALVYSDRQGNCWIEDLGSKNGTFVNDSRVSEPTQIRHGDVIRFALAACRVVDPVSVEQPPPRPASSQKAYAKFRSYKPVKAFTKRASPETSTSRPGRRPRALDPLGSRMATRL